jgi:hypothetical protein
LGVSPKTPPDRSGERSAGITEGILEASWDPSSRVFIVDGTPQEEKRFVRVVPPKTTIHNRSPPQIPQGDPPGYLRWGPQGTPWGTPPPRRGNSPGDTPKDTQRTPQDTPQAPV